MLIGFRDYHFPGETGPEIHSPIRTGMVMISLVKFNLSNPEIRDHLFEAIQYWMNEWDIDGLRLDAADCVSIDFLKELRKITSKINPDFWLMGEIVHGDYRNGFKMICFTR